MKLILSIGVGLIAFSWMYRNFKSINLWVSQKLGLQPPKDKVELPKE